MSELHTPDEWCRIKGVRVMDPDGWRGSVRDWDDALDEDEFDMRLGICTVAAWDWDRNLPTGWTNP